MMRYCWAVIQQGHETVWATLCGRQSFLFLSPLSYIYLDGTLEGYILTETSASWLAIQKKSIDTACTRGDARTNIYPIHRAEE